MDYSYYLQNFTDLVVGRLDELIARFSNRNTNLVVLHLLDDREVLVNPACVSNAVMTADASFTWITMDGVDCDGQRDVYRVVEPWDEIKRLLGVGCATNADA